MVADDEPQENRGKSREVLEWIFFQVRDVFREFLQVEIVAFEGMQPSSISPACLMDKGCEQQARDPFVAKAVVLAAVGEERLELHVAFSDIMEECCHLYDGFHCGKKRFLHSNLPVKKLITNFFRLLYNNT